MPLSEMLEHPPTTTIGRQPGMRPELQEFVLRSYCGVQDLPGIVELFNACARDYPNENYTSEVELQSDLARPEIDATSNVQLLEAAGRLIGFAALLVRAGSAHIDADIWMQTLPNAPLEAEASLIGWVESRARGISREMQLPVEVLAIVGEHRTQRAAAFASLGYSIVRQFVRMRRSLREPIAEPTLTHGYTLRVMASQKELPAWVAALNESFVDHWRYHETTIAQALHFARHDPSYRQNGDLVAIASDGSIAGLCQCVIRAEENSLTGRSEGCIALLGVRPAHRRRGLGAALLQSGLRWLRGEGMTHTLLGTDADTLGGALSLYQSNGFEVIHRRYGYARRIDPTDSSNAFGLSSTC
jgi:mycothiol synthase